MIRRLASRRMALRLLCCLIITGLFVGVVPRTPAEAAALESVSDTITDAGPNDPATHTVVFTTPNGLVNSQTVRVTFDPSGQNFDFTGLATSSVASSTTHTVRETLGGCGAGVDFYVNQIDRSSDFIEYALCTGDTVASSTQIGFVIGSSTESEISNPATESSYEVAIGGTMADSGSARVAIIADVEVTAAVNTSLEFTISGVAANETVNAESATTSTSTTATTTPFEVLVPDEAKVLAQDLAVSTNAANGFTVTLEADQTLTSGAADIDTFADGNATSVPSAWQAPSGTSGSENTYGHWGVTTEDTTLSDGDSFGDALYVGNFVNNPREVFYHTSEADGSTPDIGATRVGLKVEISGLQEAGTNYSANLTYVATPLF